MNKRRTCPASLSISNTSWISFGGTTSAPLCSALVDRDSLRLPPNTECKGFLEAPHLSPYTCATSWQTHHETLRTESLILGLWLLSDRRAEGLAGLRSVQGWHYGQSACSLPPLAGSLWFLGSQRQLWLPSFPRLAPQPFYQFWEHLTSFQ